ncbi:autophagy-related protein 33 [Monosporozyma unispora]|nr:Autophagy- protein 33 [Kazachstania unispora]
MSNNINTSLGFRITKTVAISSLGLYAGLLQSSSVVSICSPIDGVKKTLNSIYCKLGELGSAQGTITTVAFAFACYLAKDVNSDEKKALLYGLLAAPVSGTYLWATSKAVKFFTKINQKGRDDVEVELPPNHPSIFNEKGEKLHCPFGEEAEKSNNTKSSSFIGKLIPMKFMTKFVPVFQSMGLHLFIASVLATIPLSYHIYLK